MTDGADREHTVVQAIIGAGMVLALFLLAHA